MSQTFQFFERLEQVRENPADPNHEMVLQTATNLVRILLHGPYLRSLELEEAVRNEQLPEWLLIHQHLERYDPGSSDPQPLELRVIHTMPDGTNVTIGMVERLIRADRLELTKEALSGINFHGAGENLPTEELQRALEELGVDQETLDDLVHSAASGEASGINNEGTPAQLSYLLRAGWSPEDLIKRCTPGKSVEEGRV